MSKLNPKVYLKVQDHSISGEKFELIHNLELDMLETRPQPSVEKLPDYYNSEDYISHTDNKRNLFEKGYHFIKQMSLKRKVKLIEPFASEEKTLLDFGCGTGDFLKSAQDADWKISGVEPNPEARKIANTKTKNSIIDIKQISKLGAKQFDVISLWHVLEHLPNLETNLAMFKKLLKSDGRLIIAVPNFKSYDAKYYKSYWAAFDVPRHLWHFSQISISAIFGKHQMVVEKIQPLIFDAYYVSLLSEKYKSGVMNPLKAFWIGWRSNLKAKRSGEYSSLIYVLKNENT